MEVQGEETSQEVAGNAFRWTPPAPTAEIYTIKVDTEEEDESSESDDEDRPQKRRKVAKRERERSNRSGEERIRILESDSGRPVDNPQTPLDFNRMLVGFPNSSRLWIKYITYHVEMGELDDARIVAKRALEVINPSLTGEKMNIWCALLNIENLHGTSDDLEKCLRQAVMENDDFEINCRMIEMFQGANKPEQMLELITKVTKKYKSKIEFWIRSSKALFIVKKPEKARLLLQRAIASLPTRQHVDLISKFALVENKYGSQEEAQVLFEHILTCFPTKVDVWIVYVEMLLKSRRVDLARRALDRACANRLSNRKMRMLHTRRLKIEQKFGDEESRRLVKEELAKYKRDNRQGLLQF